MTQGDYKDFAILMASMQEAFSSEVTKEKIKIYFSLLQDIPIEDIKRNVLYLLKTRVYAKFPTPAEIRGETGEKDGQALTAFLKTWKTIEKYGYYDSVEFDDPVIHSVVEAMGGWMYIAENWNYEEMQWIEKEFIKLYNSLRKNKDHVKYLLGFYQKKNLEDGYREEIKPPIMIDDGQKKLTGGE